MASTHTGLTPVIGEGLNKAREPIHQARHLPGAVYTSPEVYQLEKEKFFLHDWLCIARVEEVEKPGDYMTFRIMDEPIVLTRDKEGKLNVFSNICRHRGADVAQGQGNTKEFSCPYHAWLYDLTGKLKGAPYMKEAEQFDFANCRLPPLRVGVWAGWVFTSFNADAPPLEEFVADFQREFGFLRQEECRLAAKFEMEFDCNWKLFNENGMDVYHFQTLHADSFGGHIPVEDFAFNLQGRGGFSGRYSAAPMTPHGKSLFGPMPWLQDKPDTFACMGFLVPNMFVIARYDSFQPTTVWPISPSRSRAISYTLLPEEAFGQPDFEEKVQVYKDFFRLIIEEDRQMVSSLQNNLGSSVFQPGPMSKLEQSVYNLINGYLDHMSPESE